MEVAQWGKLSKYRFLAIAVIWKTPFQSLSYSKVLQRIDPTMATIKCILACKDVRPSQSENSLWYDTVQLWLFPDQRHDRGSDDQAISI